MSFSYGKQEDILRLSHSHKSGFALRTKRNYILPETLNLSYAKSKSFWYKFLKCKQITLEGYLQLILQLILTQVHTDAKHCGGRYAGQPLKYSACKIKCFTGL